MNVQKESIQLVVCTDDNFIAHTATLLQSVRQHVSVPVVAHVFAQLAPTHRKQLKRLSDDNFAINVVSDLPDYSALPISERFRARLSQAAFWRLAIPDVLKMHSKALYLDSDMVAVDDIAPLWQQDMSDVAAGVVTDSLLSPQQPWLALNKRDPHYFNSGMMLMNLDKWREAELMQKAVSLVKQNPEWPYNDQHALNVALDGQTRVLDQCWNVQTQCLLNDADISPCLVHFTGFEKPWHQTSAHPYTRAYRQSRDATPFATSTYPLVMDEQDHQIIANLKAKLPEGGDIGIWGAGMRGRRLMTFLKQTSPHYAVTTLIDKAIKGEYMGVPIQSSLSNASLHALVIATLPHRDAIISGLPDDFKQHATLV